MFQSAKVRSSKRVLHLTMMILSKIFGPNDTKRYCSSDLNAPSILLLLSKHIMIASGSLYLNFLKSLT